MTRRIILFCFVLFLLGPAPGFAQIDDGGRELPPPTGLSAIPFRFGPPGARSLGMGGAFIALADDATASEANPAGLTRLFRPEVSIHGRSTSTDSEVVDLTAVAALDNLNGFRDVLGLPALGGGQRSGNAFAETTGGEAGHSVSEVSFASYVKPFETYTVSVYFLRTADFESDFSFRAYDDGFFDLYRTRQTVGLTLESFGVSAGFKAGDHLSIGFSLRHSQLELASRQELRVDYFNDLEFQLEDPELFLPEGAPLEALQALPIIDSSTSRQTIDGSDGDITFNVGLLFTPSADSKWSFGLVYKDGGEHEISARQEMVDCINTNGLIDLDFEQPGVQGLFCNPETLTGDGAQVMSSALPDQRFKIPDFLGLGIAWRATSRLNLALDVNAITYSDLDLGLLDDTELTPGLRGLLEPVDDEVEIHFGAEYTSFVGDGGVPLIFRGGLFTDPDHDGLRIVDSDETFFTLGIGTVLKESFQIDLAAKFGGQDDRSVVSVVYRF